MLDRRTLYGIALCLLGLNGCVETLRQWVAPPETAEPADVGDRAMDIAPRDDAEVAEVAPVNACTRDDDCTSNTGCCEVGFCYQGTCQITWLPDCCSQVGACAVSSSLYSGTCEEPCGEGSCVKGLILPEQCESAPLYRFNPDTDPLSDLTVTDTVPEDSVTWHVSGRRGLEGTRALYAGDIRCPTYHTGPLDAACAPLSQDSATPIDLSIAFPPVMLASDRPTILRLWLWIAFEPAAPTNTSLEPFDGVEVNVRPSLAAYSRTVWSSRRSDPPQGRWFPVLVDLSSDAGIEVVMSLRVTTVDGQDNNHEGVYVGRVEFLTPCADDRTCPPDAPCAIGESVKLEGTGEVLCVTAPSRPEAACYLCSEDEDCPRTDSCAPWECRSLTCSPKRVPDPGCCQADDVWPAPAGFESELGEGWLAAPSDIPGESGQWHRSDARAYDGTHSLRFGVPELPVMAPPQHAAAQTLWSPTVRVPKHAPFLSFWLWQSTEWDAAPTGPNPLGLDRLSVSIALAEITVPASTIWTSDTIGGTTQGQWRYVDIPLDAFAGLDVTVGFHFDTADESANDYEGAYIDSVTMARRCSD